MFEGYFIVDNVIAFCFHKYSPENLVKISSCAIYGWSTPLDKFSYYFEVDKCLAF